ncbi:MAG: hypothetical protein JWQ09_1253 [Segetibacter sp.]|nr:hypothetical protein [Segetibacter sp.]
MAKSSRPNRAVLTKDRLVAVMPENAQPANINVSFTAGIGQITATLFRDGVMINLQSISSEGTIIFSDVQAGDAMSVNGVCTGSGADLSIDRNTSPGTPQHFDTGFIIAGYIFQ